MSELDEILCFEGVHKVFTVQSLYSTLLLQPCWNNNNNNKLFSNVNSTAATKWRLKVAEEQVELVDIKHNIRGKVSETLLPQKSSLCSASATNIC